MIARAFMLLLVLAVPACMPAVPELVAAETSLEVGGINRGVAFGQSLPAIEVRRGDGSALMREEWLAAEAAAEAHCAARGGGFEPLPPARDYTQIRLDDGVFYFMGRCLR